MKRINSMSMQKIIDQHIIRGSTLTTDEATFYKKIRGYHHTMVNHSADEFVNGMASTNGIESVWALLNRGFNGTYHHFSKKHMDRYVNEFAFRLNEGNVKIHTMDRVDNFSKAAFNARMTYRDLVAE